MAWAQTTFGGATAWVDESGSIVWTDPNIVPVQPVTVVPVNPPVDSTCRTTRAMVIAWYKEYLGRAPEDEGAITGRVGQDCETVRIGIFGSVEAQNYARMKDTGIRETSVVAAGGGILGGILDQLLNAILPIKGISDEILAAVDSQIDKAFPALSKAVDSINKQLDDSIGTLIPNTLALVGAALGGMETLLATFLSNAADIGDIGDMIADMVKENKLPMLDGVMDLIVGDDFNLAGVIGGKIGDALFPVGNPIGDVASVAVSFFPEPRQVDI